MPNTTSNLILPEHRASTGDDASKVDIALLDACSTDLHFVQRVLADEVKPTAAVHEHFRESKAVHNGV